MIEVLISAVVTMVVFLALMQTALLSIDMNTGNALRNEAVRLADERMKIAREMAAKDYDENLKSDDTSPQIPFSDCPQDFKDVFSLKGMVFDETGPEYFGPDTGTELQQFANYNIRKTRKLQNFEYCTNLTCTELGGDGNCDTYQQVDAKRIEVAVGWKWKGEEYMHRISSIIRRGP
jgi:hypothetical protein